MIINDILYKEGHMKEKLLTINEIIAILKVSKLTIYRYIKAGKLPAYKVGRDYRIKQDDFNKLLEKNKRSI